jgi:anti-anti-sigma factor
MDITVAAEEAGTVVGIVGSLGTVTAPDAQAVLDQAIADGATTLVVDCQELAYFSSAGLRILLVAAKKVRPLGGQVRMCNLSPMVRDVFDISGFTAILPVFPSRAVALTG